jgi:hypothetical protein
MFKLAPSYSLNDENPRASNRGILLTKHEIIPGQSKNLESIYYDNPTSVT